MISVENFCKILINANAFFSKELLVQCQAFFRNNRPAIVALPAWKELKAKNPAILIDLVAAELEKT